MLGLVLGPLAVSVLPFAGFLGLLVAPFTVAYVLHRTQRGLNRIWLAARRGYKPPRAIESRGPVVSAESTSSVEFTPVTDLGSPDDAEETDAGRA